METISIVKGIASVIVAESSLFSWCKGIDSGVAIVAIFATLILWFLSKLDNDIKSLANKLDSDTRAANLRFDNMQKTIAEEVKATNNRFDNMQKTIADEVKATNKRFDKMHEIILDIVRDKKKSKRKKEPKTDP